MDSLKQLFGQFILARKYLKNISDATAYSYGNACQALFTLHGSDLRLGDLTKEQLSNRIITMRQHGLSAGGCNVYIRTVNAFLNWLHEEDRIKAKIKLPLLKEEQKVIQPFSVDQARRIVHWKPKCDSMRRLHVLMLLLLDTGMRIEEAFTLRKEQVNLDDLLITVNGKGKKQRIIPMSFEMRKILFRHLSGSTSILVFSTRNGLRLKHRNVLRDMKDVAKRIGIAGVRVSPHTFRHTFASTFIRNGGDVFALQRLLGHATLDMTRRYVTMQTADLQENHRKHASLLNL